MQVRVNLHERWGHGKTVHESTDIFSAVADPTRRSILETLANTKALAASEIYDLFPVSPQAISRHLKILREAKLVIVEKKAQQRIYRINPSAVMELENWSAGLRKSWNLRLDALEQVLDEEWNKTLESNGLEVKNDAN